MHELSIAQDMVDIVRQHLPDNHNIKVKSVNVVIGEMAGVVPDSLEFCFQVITAGTPLEGVPLRIERVPVELQCKQCLEIFGTEEPIFVCPKCGSTDVLMLKGNELLLNEIEIVDVEENK